MSELKRQAGILNIDEKLLAQAAAEIGAKQTHRGSVLGLELSPNAEARRAAL